MSLADLRGTYGVTLPQDIWESELRTIRALLEAYWEKHEEVVSPPRFFNGNDLMRAFQLEPGQRLGHLLEAIREAQGAGEIREREEVMAFARHWLQDHPEPGEISGEKGEN
jgi:poly(A) polymerase